MSKIDPKTEQKITLLLRAMDKVYPSYKQLMFRSFLQGIFMGLGTTIGVSIILGLLTFLVSQLQIIPQVNEIIEHYQVEQVLDPTS